MNKADLVNSIADKAGVTKKQADSVLSAALDIIVDTVSDGDKVTLVGFGSFEPRERKAETVEILKRVKPSKFLQPLFPHLALVNSSKNKSQIKQSFLSYFFDKILA